MVFVALFRIVTCGLPLAAMIESAFAISRRRRCPGLKTLQIG
jgi:hypothetical protein